MNCNYVAMIGRAGSNPTIKYFESVKAQATLTIAVSRSKDEEPDWVNVEAWGKLAEIFANYVHKGATIGIEGQLKWEHWSDRETSVARSKPIVKVEKLELIKSKRPEEVDKTVPSYDDTEF